LRLDVQNRNINKVNKPERGSHNHPKNKQQDPKTAECKSAKKEIADKSSNSLLNVCDKDEQFDVNKSGEEEQVSNLNSTLTAIGNSSENKSDVVESPSVEPESRHKYTYANKVKEGNKIRVKPLFGSKTSNSNQSTLKVVDTKRWIFISRVQPGTSEDDVITYLENAGIVNSVCTKLKTSYDTYASFKVGVPESEFDKVFCAEFWPNGTLFRIFNLKKITVFHSRTFLANLKSQAK